MKRLLLRSLFILFALVVAVECFSFILVTALNIIAYGNVVEVVDVHYDPYAVYMGKGSPFPTAGVKLDAAYDRNKVVWIFGGSTLLTSTDSSLDDTVPSYIARRMVAQDSGVGYDVLNFGMFGFNSLLEAKYFQRCLIESKRKPDIVVFYDGINDSSSFVQYRKEYSHYGIDRMRGIVESGSSRAMAIFRPFISYYYASYARELAQKFRTALIPVDANDETLKKYVDRIVERYDELYETCRFMGIPFVLVWQPMRWIETCKVPESVSAVENKKFGENVAFYFRHNYSTVNAALAKRLRGKPYFVDISDALCGRTVPVYWDDGVHLYDEGNKLVAGRIVPLVGERLEARRKSVEAGTLFDLFSPGTSAASLDGFAESAMAGGGPYRMATGNTATVKFTASNAGRMILSCAFYNQIPGQAMRVTMNGRLINWLTMDKKKFETLYTPVEVNQGENVLEFAMDGADGTGQSGADVPRVSFVSLKVHGYPD